MKICIDAGHGGIKNGASCNGIVEDSMALAFANKIAWYLKQYGHTVIMTRTSDVDVDLSKRAKIAVDNKCDLFISLHLNASNNSSASGCEALIAKQDTKSKNIAKAVVDALCKQFNFKNRGVKLDNAGQYPSLAVLQNTYKYMQSFLLEIGFVSNSNEAKIIKENVEKISANIAQTINKNFKK